MSGVCAQLDLSDLTSVSACVENLAARGVRIDVLVENAGIAPSRRAETKQGHEIAFGTNVLGHFTLRMGLHNSRVLSPAARIVVVTGDIYVLVSARETPQCALLYRTFVLHVLFGNGGVSLSLMRLCGCSTNNTSAGKRMLQRLPVLHVHGRDAGLLSQVWGAPVCMHVLVVWVLSWFHCCVCLLASLRVFQRCGTVVVMR